MTMPRGKSAPILPTGAIRLEPIAVEREAAAAVCGLGRSTFVGHVARGLLPKPRQIGGRVVWLVAELRDAMHALPESTLLPPPAGEAEAA